MEETLNPFIRRILAPNPSPMTFLGTNTYLLGKKEVAVIDPGPGSSSHLNTILKLTIYIFINLYCKQSS